MILIGDNSQLIKKNMSIQIIITIWVIMGLISNTRICEFFFSNNDFCIIENLGIDSLEMIFTKISAGIPSDISQNAFLLLQFIKPNISKA